MSMELETAAAQWRAYRNAAPASRIKGLSDAIRDFVLPGDTLYLGGTMARPNAAMFEISRQFWDRSPDFTLVAPAVANQHAPVIAAGLFPRIVTSIHASTFPTPMPHPVYNALDQSGEVVFENWSLLTMTQRLMAGAMGHAYCPTASIAGSDMAKELTRSGGFTVQKDPFEGGEQPVVRALRPDVTIIHALAADEAGNILVCPPYYDTKWAALAADRAVIATVEHIVSPEFIRRHADLVQIPAEAVSAVCHVPFGGHPNSCPATMVPELAGYPDDYAFLQVLRDVGGTREELLSWAEEWILAPENHEAYLKKLGGERLHALRGRTAPDGWRFDLAEYRPADGETAATNAERQLVLATRMLADKMRRGECDNILAGLGISSLAAWMAALQQREAGNLVPLMVEAGMYGYVPSPADPFLFNYRNMDENTMLSDVTTILGSMTSGPGNRAIGVLGAAQVDGKGNINTTRLPGILLTGSGGGNDIASGASQVMIAIPHSKRRLVEKVDFVTSPGRAVQTIVTNKAVLERRDGRYCLIAVMTHDGEGGADRAALIQAAIDGCGFDLPVGDDCRVEPPPTEAELKLARLLDPKGYFLT